MSSLNWLPWDRPLLRKLLFVVMEMFPGYPPLLTQAVSLPLKGDGLLGILWQHTDHWPFNPSLLMLGFRT